MSVCTTGLEEAERLEPRENIFELKLKTHLVTTQQMKTRSMHKHSVDEGQECPNQI